MLTHANPPTLKDEERPFGIDELFFSTTDRKGLIASCNEVFIRVSGYEANELLGHPHNVIRHPDMPRCVFELFWEFLLQNRSIGAYVKNRANTGEYYWVFALASPVEEGFLSVRIKPTGPLFETVRRLYAELLAVERAAENWREGMAASRVVLNERLNSLGFETYEEFMNAALRGEMRSREQLRSDAVGGRQGLFAGLEDLASLKGSLKRQEELFERLGVDISRVAMNARVRASHLSERGRALGVISTEVAGISVAVANESKEIKARGAELALLLGDISLSLAQAVLQTETRAYFVAEQGRRVMTGAEQAARYGRDVSALAESLGRSARESTERYGAAVEALRLALNAFGTVADSLSRLLMSLQFSYVTGRTLTAQVEGGEQFSLLLTELITIAESARTELNALNAAVNHVKGEVGRWRLDAGPTDRAA